MLPIPTDEELFYWLEMIDSRLIGYRHLQPWADRVIAQETVTPAWICDLSMKAYRPDVLAAVRLALSEHNEYPRRPDGMDRFHLACLHLRYERREISFATMLDECGSVLDCSHSNSKLQCEHPYAMLNEYEAADYARSKELSLLDVFIAWADLSEWIAVAKAKYEPFRKLRTAPPRV